MRAAKIIAIFLAILIAIPLLIALFVPKDYSVERQVTINKPKVQVFEYGKYLRNQDEFSKWAQMDPTMEKYFSGDDGRVGFIAGWRSEKDEVGAGEQEILAIQEGERIDYALRFFEPFESEDKAYMRFIEQEPEATLVTWGFDGHMAYPMNLMLLFMDMEEMIGDDFEHGLQRMKEILESNPY